MSWALAGQPQALAAVKISGKASDAPGTQAAHQEQTRIWSAAMSERCPPP